MLCGLRYFRIDDKEYLAYQRFRKRTKQHDESVIDEHGGSDADVKAQIGKAREAYLQLKNICNSKRLSTANTRVRIFNTNVKTVLLYGAETWGTTKAIVEKIQVFINSCLRKIPRIRWLALSATTYYGREQTTCQRRKKVGRSAGSKYITRDPQSVHSYTKNNNNNINGNQDYVIKVSRCCGYTKL
ncbi:unnamed protein product [Schistosoma curassoni]|uniref:DUF6451 domain-containing protein n=1 Tax=Schistosoma curassoni TaxID=6186 RepID=A0A183JHT0_9TREM|nr:unnamed protein product [Schistosoma curassoni]